MKQLKHIALLLFPVVTPVPSFAEDELPAEELVIQAKIPRGGDFMGFGFDSLWMMSDGRLARVNASDNSVVDMEIEGTVGKYRGIAVGEGALWVPDIGASTIYKVDPATKGVTLKIPIFTIGGEGSEGSIGVGEGAVWVITAEDHDKTLTRYNAVTGAKEAAIALPASNVGVVVDYGSVWVSGYRTRSSIGSIQKPTPSPQRLNCTTGHASSPPAKIQYGCSIKVTALFSASMEPPAGCSRRSFFGNRIDDATFYPSTL